MTRSGIAVCVAYRDACQLQFALPVDVPLIRPPVNRPLHCWVAIELVRVKLTLPPLTRPLEIVPTSCAEVPAKLPLKLPPAPCEMSNAPCQAMPLQVALHRQRPAIEAPDDLSEFFSLER